MKQVIFIGGSSYSGSTFLNLILANAPDAFSCGEVSMYFRPCKLKYLQPDCSCGDPNCQVWPNLKEKGEANLYQNIFDQFPNINIIVDSSKNPLWIKDMAEHLDASGISYKNILIWKTAEEFKASRIKRDRKLGWRRAWVNYHRSYFRLIKDWVAIRYSELAKNPALLKPLCERLDIPYHDGLENYWDKTHHSLFGNSSANIHLHKQDSNAYHYYQQELKESGVKSEIQGSAHQKINYADNQDFSVKETNSMSTDSLIQQITEVLQKKDFRIDRDASSRNKLAVEIEQLKSIPIWPLLQRTRYYSQMLMVRLLTLIN